MSLGCSHKLLQVMHFHSRNSSCCISVTLTLTEGDQAVSVQIRGGQRPRPETCNCAHLPGSGEEEKALVFLLFNRRDRCLGASCLVCYRHRWGGSRASSTLQREELLLPENAQQRPAETQRGRGRWARHPTPTSPNKDFNRMIFALSRSSRGSGSGSLRVGLAQPLQLLPDLWQRHQAGGGRLQEELPEVWLPEPAGGSQHLLPTSRWGAPTVQKQPDELAFISDTIKLVT